MLKTGFATYGCFHPCFIIREVSQKFYRTYLVLGVLLNLERQLFDLPLGLLVVLGVLASAGLQHAQLNLKLLDAGLELGHGGAAAVHGRLAGLGNALLQLAQLALQGTFTLKSFFLFCS